jgi:hypothetical protein
MKQIALATLLCFTAAIAAPVTAVAQAQQAQKTTSLAIPVVASGTNPTTNATGSFNGTLRVQRFATSGGNLVAVGLLTGVVTQTLNGVTTNASIVRTVTMPATVGGQATTAATAAPAAITAQATCDILHLDLGPLHLDLLGLVVDLNQIVLDITAESGAGNLLGNLLCAVTGLLDNPSGLANLLNQILAILG